MKNRESKKTKTKKIIEFLTRDWMKDIKLSVEYNTCLFPRGLDDVGNLISAVLLGRKGTATGGIGYDLNDGTEVKNVCLIQSKECLYCNTKNIYFSEKCIKCKKRKFELRDDSRFGIDAKTHFAYLNKVPRYILNLIEPSGLKRGRYFKLGDKIKLRIRSWLVDSGDSYFNSLAQNQLNKGRNKLINFMPLKWDFYMSSPCLIFDALLKLMKSRSELEIRYLNLRNKKPELTPVDIMTREQLLMVAKIENINLNKNLRVTKIKKIISKNIGHQIDKNKYGFIAKKKTLGKKRGLVKRRIY